MVKIDANSNHQSQHSQELLSTIFLSIGALTLIVTLFLGIKWKRFRYRMSFQNTPGENLITIRRHSTTTTIRENCSEGRYRHSTTEELITSGNDIQPTLRNTSTHNVKLESSDRGSIFRWPFRNKIKISSSNFTIDENRVLDSNEEAVHRRERDSMLAEKNERLRRSIYERLNSTTSMPDLVNDSQPGTYEQKFEEPILVIRKGVESELDETAHYQIVDEIHDREVVETIPIRVKESSGKEVCALTTEMTVQKESNDKVSSIDKENETFKFVTPPKPPIRRRSKASDLTHPEEKKIDQEIQITPPVVKPRKRLSNLTVTIDKPVNEIDEPSIKEAAVPKEFRDETSVDIENVDSKQNEDSKLETILSPPIEYKDTSIHESVVTSEQTNVLSPNDIIEILIEEQKSSLNKLTEVSNHEQSTSLNEAADPDEFETTSSQTMADSNIDTVYEVPSQKQDFSLPKELQSSKYPASNDSPPSSRNELPSQDDDYSIDLAIMTPKSILKTQQDKTQQPKSTVQFINVPDSSSDDDDLYEDSRDVWSQIEVHRNQLMLNHEFNNVYISRSSGDSPPPLPKTPPPTADIQERNFEFA